MSDDHHKWFLNEELPQIRPHSVAKHRVIYQYLRRYVEVLTGNLRIPEFYLTLVDGFAGGGLYRDSQSNEVRYGSPFLMLQAMREAAAEAQTKRTREFRLDVNYFFVESAPETYKCLKANLQKSEYQSLLGADAKLINDEFVNQVTPIVQHVKSRGRGNRAIFVLDQLGYTDVPFAAIRSILDQLDNAEIILTFATDSLIDYLSQSDTMQKTLENLGLSLPKEDIKSAKLTADWRRTIQFKLHSEIQFRSGARFYTPFFIRSKDAHRDYWLIHLSNHSRARDVMAELHWLENTSFAHFGKPGLVMLGYDQDEDIKLTGQQMLLPEYRFDEQARALTHETLMEQLPERLFPFKAGVSFGDFFASITNETPATSLIIKQALGAMLQEKMIQIRDKTGNVTRESGVQHKTDIIVPSQQRRLFMPEIG